ncbi:CBS DOMAIN-CONTAINING PROTEIN CBSX2 CHLOROPLASTIC [Salix purpurea]|uniref:CBS DOMAIN-CONTAINING PROTEIN CBSX2 CHLOROPLASTIC n=1 Tax=Salix purpurea TaxID=77065 RepID=A0A9Q0WVQ5_SALPP|nr:CBS DOMAIN-CONTAINING PROTEIN CBSX2 CHLOROPLASTIC [Salix purpurea]
MTRKEDLHVVKPTTTVNEALETLVDRRITGFPVIDDDWKLVGLVSDYDLLALDSISGGGRTETNMFPEVDSTWKVCENFLLFSNPDVLTFNANTCMFYHPPFDICFPIIVCMEIHKPTSLQYDIQKGNVFGSSLTSVFLAYYKGGKDDNAESCATKRVNGLKIDSIRYEWIGLEKMEKFKASA